MQWDDRKGKYIQPFTKKKIELLPYLYLEGYRLYWDFPRPISMVEFNKIHTWEEDASEEEIEKIMKIFKEDFEKEIDLELKYKLYIKLEKYLNMVLSVLPYIPFIGLILGVII